ncbi:MAG TPA: DUF6580 family putative transport protein [candidate division Zixibacteria bacterium]|nr:DUF6580 family putative transport protein [candidate division Zixibacteria bacterium]
MIYFLTLLAILIRLLPHAPNFAPLGALALLAGMTGDKRKLYLPLGAVFATDLVLGFYSGFVWIYLSYGLLFFTGCSMRKAQGMKKTIALPLAGSVLFYFVSNFGVWASGSMYPPTEAGLVQCYLAALPFFRNTLASDLIYFNAFALLAAWLGQFALPKLAANKA